MLKPVGRPRPLRWALSGVAVLVAAIFLSARYAGYSLKNGDSKGNAFLLELGFTF